MQKNEEAIRNFENSLYHVPDDLKVYMALCTVYKKMNDSKMVEATLVEGCEQMR